VHPCAQRHSFQEKPYP